MIHETSYGAIVFRRSKEDIMYLLLHYSAGHWEFPRGHPEEGETELQTVIRELKEETGISDAKFIDGFKKEISFNFKRGKEIINKTAVFYLIETANRLIKISSEHTGYKWAELQAALKTLTFDDSKKVIEAADDFIQKNQI
jgi:bis(5'-nucleosidyl)-tetraphosphatase